MVVLWFKSVLPQLLIPPFGYTTGCTAATSLFHFSPLLLLLFSADQAVWMFLVLLLLSFPPLFF
jgi:hypothetical protein